MEIGTVNLGLLNRIIVDDVLLQDKQHRDMLTCHRVSAKVNILDLLLGKISISSAQIFGLKAQLVKPDADTPMNYQFVIDSLQSKDTTKKSKLDLRIASLVIRNSAMTYDRLDMPHKSGVVDFNHISLDKISSHIMLNSITNDSLSVRVKKLSFSETKSGFNLNKLSFFAKASNVGIHVKDFSLTTDNSDISLGADCYLHNKKVTAFNFVSNLSSISLRDIAMFYAPFRNINSTIFLDANLTGSSKAVRAKKLTISTSGRTLFLNATARIQSYKYLYDNLKNIEALSWKGNVTAHIDQMLASQLSKILNVESPVISRLGNIDYTGSTVGNRGIVSVTGKINTSIGNVAHDVNYNGTKASVKLKTSPLHLGTLLATDIVGDVETTLTASANISNDKKLRFYNGRANLVVPSATIKGYPYRNLKVDFLQNGNTATASLDIADLNVNGKIKAVASNAAALLEGKVKDLRNISLTADISHINPNMLGLLKGYVSTAFTLNTKAEIASLANPIDNIKVILDNFSMRSPTKYCGIHDMQFTSSTTGGRIRNVSLHSQFADIEAYGRFNFNTLKNSLTNIIAQKLPTLPGLPQYKKTDNNIRLSAIITNAQILRDLLNIDLDIYSPVKIDGYIDDIAQKADLRVDNESISYSGTILDGTHLHLFTENDTLTIRGETNRRDDNGGRFMVAIDGKAANNNMTSSISWDNGKGNQFRGTLNTTGQFFKNAVGQSTAHIDINPSDIMIGDSLWHIRPADITYSAKHLDVRNFCVEHGYQNVRINGLATSSDKDSLVVNLQDVNVAYILNMVNFHAVEFSGFASGTAVAKSLFSKPDAYADLDVQNFRFENGRLGTLTVNAGWNNDLGQIDIKARCIDDNVTEDLDGKIDIDGYISIKRNYIDLGVDAENARLEFMHTYCNSFIDRIDAWASGKVRIWGDLSKINLTGDAVANGTVHITSLNCDYTLHDDSVHFVPNDMVFENCRFTDKDGNEGWISGGLHHKYLSRMTFDLDVKAKHLLCFDFPTLNGETFCGHVVGTGTCNIKGRPGEITFDIEAYPEKTSEITYDVSSNSSLQNQEFITWRDASLNSNDTVAVQIGSDGKLERKDPDESFHTNIYLNFLIHATPQSTLKLIMDQRTGDVITFNGSGTLRANYYNKGSMQIYGNYNIDQGAYKMTIQQVITKNFEFLPGGSLSFAGNPFDAELNLQAQYVVPSVPLSDLNIGNSFTNSTVRVNCLMNISGKAGNPQIDFDLNLPQASTDIQSMITSLMDTEQERNQQVLYLLSVGRFYAADNNGSDASIESKTSIAMQSFISGTLSQQLNNILSDMVVKSNDWNFGANISPGDEGMNNAEYEGIISGKMLNNRLLINGQFGYRDNANATSSFIGDFDVRYLLFPSGNLQLRVYNQTSDRYFTKSNLNTQGIGIVFKHDFDSPLPYFLRKDVKKKKKQKKDDNTQ